MTPEQRQLNCLLLLRDRLKAAGRVDDVVLIDAALQCDDVATIRAMISPVSLTYVQLELLKALFALTSNGVSPSMQEIADRMGRSKVSVHECIHTLMEKGVVTMDQVWHRGRHRSLRIVDRRVEKVGM